MRTLPLCALLLAILILTACQAKDEPLPTPLDPVALATRRADDLTATFFAQTTLETLTPTASPTVTLTPSSTPTATPSITPTPSATVTLTPTSTYTPSQTFTPRPPVFLDVTSTPTMTYTPSITPTRVLNPDAVVGGSPTALRIAPQADAESVADLPAGTALGIDAKSADDLWLQIHLLNGMGNGWVIAEAVIAFKDLGSVPVFGVTGTPTLLVSDARQDLSTPPAVTVADQGAGAPFLPYDFAACGNTYWEGDGLGASMEDLAFEGRYPRFAAEPIRVYVYGLDTLTEEDRSDWELAIVQTFAELSQAAQFERVYLDDLKFFVPFVPMTTLLADARVDMVWHIAPPEVYEESAPCDDDQSCSAYGFSGKVKGGPLRFGGITYVPSDAANKRAALLHATLHALGLWVHSSQPADVLSSDNRAEHMSPRDVATLRCLFTAPPFGDAVVDDR